MIIFQSKLWLCVHCFFDMYYSLKWGTYVAVYIEVMCALLDLYVTGFAVNYTVHP